MGFIKDVRDSRILTHKLHFASKLICIHISARSTTRKHIYSPRKEWKVVSKTTVTIPEGHYLK